MAHGTAVSGQVVKADLESPFATVVYLDEFQAVPRGLVCPRAPPVDPPPNTVTALPPLLVATCGPLSPLSALAHCPLALQLRSFAFDPAGPSLLAGPSSLPSLPVLHSLATVPPAVLFCKCILTSCRHTAVGDGRGRCTPCEYSEYPMCAPSEYRIPHLQLSATADGPMHYAMITFSAAVEYIRSEKLRCSGTVLAAGAAPSPMHPSVSTQSTRCEHSEYPM